MCLFIVRLLAFFSMAGGNSVCVCRGEGGGLQFIGWFFGRLVGLSKLKNTPARTKFESKASRYFAELKTFGRKTRLSEVYGVWVHNNYI